MGLSLTQRFVLKMQGLPTDKLSKALKIAEENGLEVSTSQLISHLHCRGDVLGIINGLIFARENNIEIDWNTASAIDLVGLSTGRTLEQVLDTCCQYQNYTL